MEALKIELVPSNGLSLKELLNNSEDNDRYLVKMSDGKLYFLECFRGYNCMMGTMNGHFYFDYADLNMVEYRKIEV